MLDMGLGKTVITLTAIKALLDDWAVAKVLIIAPKKVADSTWATESQKWDHTKDLRVVKVMAPRISAGKRWRRMPIYT